MRTSSPDRPRRHAYVWGISTDASPSAIEPVRTGRGFGVKARIGWGNPADSGVELALA